MSVGNPLNRKRDYSAPGHPFFKAYRHPAVIAYKYGDEPKDKKDVDRLEKSYRAIRVHHKKPIVTAVIGESMTRNEQEVAIESWVRLNPDVRLARYYSFRRTYSIVDQYQDKTELPFEKWAELMEESGSQSWWYVLQAFGKGIYPEKKSYWRFPTETEITAMAHLALAHGARGLVAYSLQNHKGRLTGLMNAKLVLNQARDGSIPINGYARIAKYVRENAAVLMRHAPGDFTVQLDNPDISAIPRRDPKTRSRMIYLVNKNAEKTASGELKISGLPSVDTAIDLYTGRKYSITTSDAKLNMPFSLEKGEGRLLSLSVGPNAENNTESKMVPVAHAPL